MGHPEPDSALEAVFIPLDAVVLDAVAEQPVGLLFTTRRQLSDEEMKMLEADVTRLQKRSNKVLHFCLHALWITGGLWIVDRATATHTPSAFIFFGMIASMTLLMLLIPGLLLAEDGWFQLSRVLRRDVQAGYVKRYEGLIPKSDPYNPSQAKLLRQHLLKVSETEMQWLEILPESGLVWRVNGRRPRSWARIAVFQFPTDSEEEDV